MQQWIDDKEGKRAPHDDLDDLVCVHMSGKISLAADGQPAGGKITMILRPRAELQPPPRHPMPPVADKPAHRLHPDLTRP